MVVGVHRLVGGCEDVRLAGVELAMNAANDPVAEVGPVQALQRGNDEPPVSRVDAHPGRRVRLASLDDGHGLERPEGVRLDPQIDVVDVGGAAYELAGFDDDRLLAVLGRLVTHCRSPYGWRGVGLALGCRIVGLGLVLIFGLGATVTVIVGPGTVTTLGCDNHRLDATATTATIPPAMNAVNSLINAVLSVGGLLDCLLDILDILSMPGSG